MKTGIHPEYHTITVVMTDGSKYQTRSTWGKEGDVMTLDVDSKSHPAWQKDGAINLRKTGQMEKFASKFSNFGSTGKSAMKEAPQPVKKPETKKAKEEKAKKDAAPKAEAKAEAKAETAEATPKEKKAKKAE